MMRPRGGEDRPQPAQAQLLRELAQAREQLAAARNEAIIAMDGGPLLSVKRIKNRYTSIRNQVKIGLERKGKPTATDGGLLAIPTGKEKPSDVWDAVPAGKESVTYIGDYGSTNWKVSRAEKNDDGSISKKQLKKIVYPDDQVRKISISEFIDNMVDPIVKAYEERAQSGNPDGPIHIGIKFGFPHRNEEHDGRTDAIITDVKKNGKYSKNWRFTDVLEGQEINVTALMTERLRERGVNVASVVAKNDTNAVATDEDAALRALSQRQLEIEQRERLEELPEPNKMTALAKFIRDKRIQYREQGKKMPADEAELPELVVLDAGFVGGGGTNGAAKGGINLELGRAILEGEEDGEVHEMMREMGLVEGDKIAEQETGNVIVSRIAATLALLDKKELLDGGRSYAEKLLKVAKDDQTIVDVLAYGSPKGELTLNDANRDVIQDVAKGELLRAGVNYGILIANTIAASPPDAWHNQNVQYGLRVEGSVLLKGAGIKEIAVQVAQDLLDLRYPPELIEADGDLGVASLAMSKRQFAKAD